MSRDSWVHGEKLNADGKALVELCYELETTIKETNPPAAQSRWSRYDEMLGIVHDQRLNIKKDYYKLMKLEESLSPGQVLKQVSFPLSLQMFLAF